VKVCSAQMGESLAVVCAPDRWGVKPVAYFSELPDDIGTMISGIPVQHLTDIPKLDPELDVKVALVACSPDWVQITLDLLHKAGIKGVLLLTPRVGLSPPEGMEVTHVRMPCDIKSLACRCQDPVTR